MTAPFRHPYRPAARVERRRVKEAPGQLDGFDRALAWTATVGFAFAIAAFTLFWIVLPAVRTIAGLFVSH